MVGEWKNCRLADVAKIQGGFAFKSKDFVESGVPVVKIKNVRKRNIDLSEVDCVSVDLAKKCSSFYVREGDVLISMTGSGINAPASIVGRVARHTGDNRDFLINQRVGRFVVCNDEKLDLRYLYYFFSRSAIQNLLVSIATGSANQVNISGKQIESVEIPLPPIKEQKAIAHILGILDDKIQLNRQMNATLEAMAQALFKSWFVDFDPVIDKALAAGNPIPESLHKRAEARRMLGDKRKPLPDDVAAHFPSEFEFSEKIGWIPKGWEIGQIGNLCKKIQNGGTPRRNIEDYWKGGTIPWLISGEVRQTIITNIKNNITELGLEKSSAKWLPAGSAVVAMYGATAGQVAFISKKLTTNQAVCGLIPKPNFQFFNYLTLERIVQHFESRATGSAQQNISKGVIEETKSIIPSEELALFFEKQCEFIFSKWINNLEANNSLVRLRDTLLPQLLSGQLRIPNAENFFKDA